MKKNLLKILLLYRLIFYFLAITYISKITILGDYIRYLNQNFLDVYKTRGWQILINSTYFTDFLLSFIKYILLNNSILLGIFLNIISTICLYSFWKNTNKNKIIGFFLFLPSFTLWSSYPSKEIIVVITECYICGALLKLNRKKKINKILLIVSIYILFLYKKQYIPVVLFAYFYINFKDKIKLRKRILIIITFNIFIFILLFSIRRYVDDFAKDFYKHFVIGSKETVRNLDIFSQENGFYRNILYGLFMAYWGVSFFEIFQGGIKLIAYIEIFILSIIFIYYIFKVKRKGKVERIWIFLNAVFLLLLPQYPFAIFNSGSAIRYRTNIYIILIFLFYQFILRTNKRRKINFYLL